MKVALEFLIIPTVLLFLIIGATFYLNYDTTHGRYNYTGSESLSLFGFLDLAHYRPEAFQELFGWQFFFGNMQYFIIFAIVMAGFFHLFTPKKVSAEKSTEEIMPNKKQHKIGMIALVGVIAIILFEIIISVVGNPETGLGSKLFIEGYYRDIPTLITEGYYILNNHPYHQQMFLSLIPVMCGFGLFFYMYGLKRFRKRGLISKKIKSGVVGKILLVAGLLYLIILIIPRDISMQFAMTEYTAYMMCFWILGVMWVTGMMLVIIRVMLPKEPSRAERNRFNVKPAFTLLGIALVVFFTSVLFIAPNLEEFGGGDNITFDGIDTVQIVMVGFVVFIGVFLALKRKIDPLVKHRLTAFLFGFGSFIILFFYGLLNSHNFDAVVEIHYMVNSIIPTIFLVCLTTTFYFLGFALKRWSKKLKEIVHEKSKKSSRRSWKVLNSPKLKVVLPAFLVCFGVLIPTLVTGKIFREKPEILVNNYGLFPNQEKTFFFATSGNYSQDTGTFEVINVDTGAIAYSGILTRKGFLWQKHHWIGNFTDLTTEGNYYVKATLGQLQAKSYEFQIAQDYLEEAFSLGLYWYYYARCGTAVEPVHEGVAGHEACHTHDAWYLFNNSGTYEYRRDLNLTGGWHDSGDYNVYSERMALASQALVYAFDKVPNFFHKPLQRTGYPTNDTIPDIIEEAWHGTQWWMRRFYEPEQLFFRGNELGENGSERYTVWSPPEFEEDFWNGRYVTGDHVEGDLSPVEAYQNQFKKSSGGLYATATIAAMARFCETYGYYTDNITAMKEMANKSRIAYDPWVVNNAPSLAGDIEMYKLTNNNTYFQSASEIANHFIENPGEYRATALALQFAKEFNGTMGWNGLDYVQGNNTIQAITDILNGRTKDETNFFNFLRDSVNGPPVHYNYEYWKAIMMASYAYNLTNNNTLRRDLYDFCTRHFDWMFGRNMENVCMMEGLEGAENALEDYWTRYAYIPGCLKGAYPGFLADGFRYFPGDFSGSHKNNNNSLELLKVIPKTTYVYSEVWSSVACAFQLACSAFFSQVLGYD